MIKQQPDRITRRKLLHIAGMSAVMTGAVAGAPFQTRPLPQVNKNSAPSDLKITDMRACTVAANYDYPIIRVDTNQGVYGLG